MKKFIFWFGLCLALGVTAVFAGPQNPTHTINIYWEKAFNTHAMKRFQDDINREFIWTFEGIRAAVDSADTAFRLADTAFRLADTAFKCTWSWYDSSGNNLPGIVDSALGADNAAKAGLTDSTIGGSVRAETCKRADSTHGGAIRSETCKIADSTILVEYLAQPGGHVQYIIGDYMVLADTFWTNGGSYDTIYLPEKYSDDEYIIQLTQCGNFWTADSLCAGKNSRTDSSFIIQKRNINIYLFWTTMGYK